MGDKSKIEWTDATWNPVTGCSKVSKGCTNCYAERVFPRPYPGRAFTDVRCHPERLEQPLKWKQPRRIFVNSMSDLFHESIPEAFIRAVFVTMKACQQHTFQILTKRPERMLSILRGWKLNSLTLRDGCGAELRNAWLGVSVEDQKTADERISLLLKTPAAVRFVSYEPALGPIDFWRWLPDSPTETLDWIIAGGESGPHARPAHPDWFRSVRDQCQAAGVPFFFKQWGEWCPGECVSRTHGNVETAKWFDDHWIFSRENLARTDGHRDDQPDLYSVGKRQAGRSLDGREWNEFPEVRQ